MEDIKQPETKVEEDKKDEPKAEEKPQLKYSEEDLDRIISKRYARWKEQEEKRIDEAKKLEQMNADEKREYTISQLQEQLQEYKKRETLHEMAKVARSMLQEKNISLTDSMLSTLLHDQAEKTKENVQEFIELYEQSVNDEVNKRLKGQTPKTGSNPTITKDDIQKIEDPVERREMIGKYLSLFQQ